MLELFGRLPIYIINGQTFKNLLNYRGDFGALNQILNKIIAASQDVVDGKEGGNPNNLLKIDAKTRREIVSSIVGTDNAYWFLPEFVYMILFNSDKINLKELESRQFYEKNINRVYDFIKKTKDYDKIKGELFTKFCTKNGAMSINKIREHLKKEYGESFANVPISAKSCEEKFGPTELTKDCIESQICNLLIVKDALNKIESKEFDSVMENILKNIMIYYSYLGNQSAFILQSLQYKLSQELDNPSINNRQQQNISVKLNQLKPASFRIPAPASGEFAPLLSQQMEQISGGGINMERYLHKLNKIPKREFKKMVDKVGKKDMIKFLNIHKGKKVTRELLAKIRS